tara:strand:- start:234 stop:731 length:498 start_codon:yes stop_codon:yes gene_type:complete
VEALARLHGEVSAAADRIAEGHGERLQCARGCSGCCVDELSVFGVEAARIQAEAATLLSEAPGPAGACAFLDAAGACRVYAARPYVCRTQGLPLRWIDEDAAGELVERRDICELNEPGQPDLVDLATAACWPLGPVEEQLQGLQAAYEPDTPLRRVRLRALFSAN